MRVPTEPIPWLADHPSPQMATHFWNHKKSNVSYQLSIINDQLSDISCQLSDIRCQLSIINYQVSTVSYLLSTINYQLLAINYQLGTVAGMARRAVEYPAICPAICNILHISICRSFTTIVPSCAAVLCRALSAPVLCRAVRVLSA